MDLFYVAVWSNKFVGSFTDFRKTAARFASFMCASCERFAEFLAAGHNQRYYLSVIEYSAFHRQSQPTGS